MTILAVPLTAAALFGFGGLLLLVIERKGERTGCAFLGALAACAVLGLAVAAARSAAGPAGSPPLASPRAIVE